MQLHEGEQKVQSEHLGNFFLIAFIFFGKKGSKIIYQLRVKWGQRSTRRLRRKEGRKYLPGKDGSQQTREVLLSPQAPKAHVWSLEETSQ